MSEITKALVAFNKSIEGNIKKDSQGYGYYYADLSSTIEFIRKKLSDVGIAVTQTTEIIDYKDDPTYAERVFLITTLHHISGESIKSKFPLFLQNKSLSGKTNDMQNLGSTITYSRRYCLLAILNLATEDDDGASSNVTISKPKSDTFPLDKQKKTIKKVYNGETPPIDKNIYEQDLVDTYLKFFTDSKEQLDEIEDLGRLLNWKEDKLPIFEKAREQKYNDEVDELSKLYKEKLAKIKERKNYETSV